MTDMGDKDPIKTMKEMKATKDTVKTAVQAPGKVAKEVQALKQGTISDTKLSKGLAEGTEKALSAAAKRKAASKAALKIASKVALKAIPGVNLISTGFDLWKAGRHLYKNREQIAGKFRQWGDSFKSNMDQFSQAPGSPTGRKG
jgi:hypothetical protein